MGIEVIYLTIWTLVDPLRRVMESFQPEFPEDIEEDIRILPQLEHCESVHNNIWLGKHFNYILHTKSNVSKYKLHAY